MRYCSADFVSYVRLQTIDCVIVDNFDGYSVAESEKTTQNMKMGRIQKMKLIDKHEASHVLM